MQSELVSCRLEWPRPHASKRRPVQRKSPVELRAEQSCRGRLWGQKRRWYLTRTTCSRTSTRVRQRQEDGKCETIAKRGMRRNVHDPEGTSCCAAAHSAQRRPEERILVSRSGPPENFSLTMCVEVLTRRTFWTWPALADHQGPLGSPRPPRQTGHKQDETRQ